MKRVNGTGSVHRVKDNKSKPWRATATTGFIKGKQKKIVLGTYKTKREAEAALEAHRLADGRVSISEHYNISVGELTTRWLASRSELSGRKKALSDHTISMYQSAIARLERLHNRRLVDITIDDLQAEFDKQIEEGYSRSAVNQCKSTLKQVYDYAIPRGIVSVNLALYIKVDMRGSAPTQRFTREQIDLMIENADRPWIDSILIMIYTAMRPTELLTLPKSRVDLSRWILQWGIKTDAGIDRVIPIHPVIRPYVERRMQTDGPLLIMRDGRDGRPREIDRRDYNSKIFKPALRELGLPEHLSPRSCRKTGSSLFAEAGLSDSARIKILGHTDIALTEKVYTDLDIAFLVDEMSKVLR